MVELTIHLVYPPSLVNVPVINQLIRNFNVNINILRAEITNEQGWLDIRMSGPAAVVETAIEWLKDQGIEVNKTQG
ncbi:MAG: FeS-binding protein [Chloroflexota bacterium]|nr:MAG: FeS-binding protein [Chloroflexota bacterium]